MKKQSLVDTKTRIVRVTNGLLAIVKKITASYLGLSENEMLSNTKQPRISVTGKCAITREIQMRLIEEGLRQQNFIIIPVDVLVERNLLNVLPLSKKMLACMLLESKSTYIRWYIRYILFRRFVSKNFFRIVLGLIVFLILLDMSFQSWEVDLKAIKRYGMYVMSLGSLAFLWKSLNLHMVEYFSSLIVRGTKEQLFMQKLHRLAVASLSFGQPLAFVYRNLMAIDPEEFGEWVVRINNTQRHHCVAVTSFDKMILKNKLGHIFKNSDFDSLDQACRHFTDIEIHADYQADITNEYDYMHKLMPELIAQIQFDNIHIVPREKVIEMINHVLQSWHVFYYSYEDINYVIYNVQLSAYVLTMKTEEEIEILVLRYLFRIAAPEMTNSDETLKEYIDAHFDEEERDKVYQLVNGKEVSMHSLHHLHQKT